MNTRKLRKAILTLCSALLLVSLSVGITLAYLTDTDEVLNTFTVGQVGICLDESDVDGSKTNPITADDCDNESHNHADRDSANTYKFYPNGSYTKDPKIWFDDDCEMGYLRVVVTFDNVTEAVQALNLPMEQIFVMKDDSTAFGGWNDDNLWNRTEVVEGDTVVYTLTFKDYIHNTTPDITLFETIKIPSELNNEDIAELAGVTMSIKAYAVQADTLETDKGVFTLDDANNAFDTAFDGIAW